jgi:hypothetical protein
MRQKRGQLTLFVIMGLAILVLIVAGGYFIISLNNVEDDHPDHLKQQHELGMPQDFIKSCVGEAVDKALKSIYSQGGEINVTSPKLFYDLKDVNNITNFSYGGNTDFFIAKFANQACASLSAETFENAKVEVFPNPAKDKLQVNISEEVSYHLYNIMGVLVQKGKLNTTDNNMNINNLTSGCYVLQLTNAAGVVKSVKVIKE